jgi:hypothetical protein
VVAFAAGVVLAFGLGFAFDFVFDLDFALGFAAESCLPFAVRLELVVSCLELAVERGVRDLELDAWFLVFLAAAITA